MSQSLTILAPSAYLNFTANAVRYIMNQKNFMKMSNQNKQNQNQQNQDTSQEQPKKKIRSRARKAAAINDAMHLAQQGLLYRDICAKIAEKYDYKANSSYIEQLVAKANKLVKEKIQQYSEDIASRNIGRLEMMIQQCLDNNDISQARKCIDILNKTANLYNNKIEINNGNDKNFKIKIE